MRRVILAICATAVALVLLLSFKSHTQPPAGSPAAALGSPSPGADGATGSSTTGSSTTGTPTTGTPTTGTPTTGASAAKAATTATAQAATAAKTFTGAAWPTIYGPVQVQITVKGGKLSAVNAVEYPTETPRDDQINSFAIPELNSEALAAGSAKIDTVSGATYTSGGYVGSLQSALDKAGIA